MTQTRAWSEGKINESINENELVHAIRNSHKIERGSEVPRRGRGEQGLEFGQDWRTKNRNVNTNEIRCECQRR